MRITDAVAGYKYVDFGNIKLAFTQVCKDELFEDVYFAADATIVDKVLTRFLPFSWVAAMNKRMFRL